MKKVFLFLTLIIPLIASSQITQYTAFRIWAIDSFRLGDRWIRKISTNLNSPDSNSHNMIATNRAIMDMIRSGGGGTVTGGSEGIRLNGVTLELGDIAGQNTVPFTADRYIYGSNFSMYLMGNKTTGGNANLIFRDSQTVAIGNTVTKDLIRFDPLINGEGSVPFKFHQEATRYGAWRPNEVIKWGVNIDRADPTKNSIGYALEQHYAPDNPAFPLVESHHHYHKAGAVNPVRLWSFTINPTTDDIDYFQTAHRSYAKRPWDGGEYWRVESTEATSVSAWNLTGGFGTIQMRDEGVLTTPTPNLDFTLNGFRHWFLTDGLNYANNLLGIGNGPNFNGIQLNGTPVALSDRNQIYGNSTSTAITILAGSNPTISADNGPFIVMRGNTYSANVGERGILAFGAGNPSSPTGVEGEMRFHTGGTQVRMRIKPDGTTLITSLAGSGTRMVTADASGNLGTTTIANTLYSGDGTIAGNRAVNANNLNLTFDDVNIFRVNYDYFAQSNANGSNIYTAAIGLNSRNYWQFGYTPVAVGSFTRGNGIIVDTLNNVGLGDEPQTTMPLYNIGNSVYTTGFQSRQGNFYGVTNVISSQTVTLQQNFFVVDATGGAITITLPAASTAFGTTMGIDYVFKRVDNSGNAVNIQRAGSDTIDGGTSFTLTTQYEAKKLRCISTSAWAVY